MPSGKKINWAKYDYLIKRHLSKMTITNWVAKYAPTISEQAVGSRARKLKIKSAKYYPTKNQINQMIQSLRKETPELINEIKKFRDDFSLRELSIKLNISYATLCRIIKRNKIKLSTKGRKRATASTRQAHIGKIPWNKNGCLSETTKAKISIATKGKKNSQYGRGMTEKEKEKWRKAWKSNGKIKMLIWRKSKEGLATQAKANKKLRSSKYRQAASNRTCELVKQGKIKHRGKPTKMNTIKGGKFTTKSSYETKFVKLLEISKDVVQFEYEPFKIPYEYNGSKRNYIPDFLVEYKDGHKELIEVKPSRLVNFSKTKTKIQAGYDYSRDHFYTFKVITESDLGL